MLRSYGDCSGEFRLNGYAYVGRECFMNARILQSALLALTAIFIASPLSAQHVLPWQPLGLPHVTRYIAPVTDFARHPDGTLFATTGIVFRSIDQGVHWDSALNSELPRPSKIQNSHLAISPDSSLYLTVSAYDGSGGLFLSHDKGDSWIHMKADSLQDNLSDPMSIVVNHTGTLIYACGGLANYSKGLWGLVRSTDHGTTWHTVGHNIIDYQPTALACAPDSTLYLGTTWGLYRSVDDGRSWINVLGGQDAQLGVNNICVDGFGRVYAACTHGLYRSTDRGTGWTALQLGLPASGNFTAVSACGDGVVYAATGNGIYTSIDFGDTWSLNIHGLRGSSVPNSSGNQGALALLTVDCAFTLVGCRETNGIMFRRRVDSMWHHTYGQDSLAAISPDVFAVCPSGTLYLESRDSLLYSYKHGMWNAVTPDTIVPQEYLLDLFALTDAIIIGHALSGKIALSRDGGVTWTVRSTPIAGFFNGFFMNNMGEIYVTSGMNALRSVDTGLSWADVNGIKGTTSQITGVSGSGPQVVFSHLDGHFEWSIDHGQNFFYLGTVVNPGQWITLGDSGLLLFGASRRLHILFEGPSDSGTIQSMPSDLADAIIIGSDHQKNIFVRNPDDHYFRSMDRGASWFADDSGLALFQSFDTFDEFEFDSQGKAFLRRQAGVYMQTNNESGVQNERQARRNSIPDHTEIVISPNPSSALATITTLDVPQSVLIVDPLGRIVAQFSASEEGHTPTVFTLTTLALSSGIYECLVHWTHGISTARFLVAH